MSIAKEVNSLLDDMLHIKSEIKRMRADLNANDSLVNKKTGEKISADKIEALAEAEIANIKDALNRVTNEGRSVKGIFDCIYYVNDMIQDKLLVEAGQTTEDAGNQ